MAIANAWILFQKYSTRENLKYYDHLAFRQELAKQLIGCFSSYKKVSSSRPTLSTNVQINMSGHQFVRMPCKRPRRCIVHSNSSQINVKGKKQFMAAINATVIFVMITFVWHTVLKVQMLLRDNFSNIHILTEITIFL